MSYIEGDASPFMKAFRDKGRVSSLLDLVPVYAVLAEDLGLRGAHVCAIKLARENARVGEKGGKGAKNSGSGGGVGFLGLFFVAGIAAAAGAAAATVIASKRKL